MPMFSRVVILGSGNVATQLAHALYQKGIKILQIYSRTLASAQKLAAGVGAEAVNSLSLLDPSGDLYLMAVTDTAIPEIACQLPFRCPWLVHTAGSVSIRELNGMADHTGVLYPFQTISKYRIPDFGQVPFFVEVADPADMKNLIDFAGILSAHVYEMNSEKRLRLHLAGVFVSNFVNHFYAIGASLLEKEGLPFSVMVPLMEETFRKASESGNPALVQTGPASRGDRAVIENQILQLKDYPDWQKLYIFVTESILKEHS